MKYCGMICKQSDGWDILYAADKDGVQAGLEKFSCTLEAFVDECVFVSFETRAELLAWHTGVNDGDPMWACEIGLSQLDMLNTYGRSFAASLDEQLKLAAADLLDWTFTWSQAEKELNMIGESTLTATPA